MQRSHIRNGVMTITQQKTGAEVFVPLHPALSRSIKAGPVKGVYLIGDKNGRPILARTLSDLISAAVRAATSGRMRSPWAQKGRPEAFGRTWGLLEGNAGGVGPSVAARDRAIHAGGGSAAARQSSHRCLAGQRLNIQWLTTSQVSQFVGKSRLFSKTSL